MNKKGILKSAVTITIFIILIINNFSTIVFAGNYSGSSILENSEGKTITPEQMSAAAAETAAEIQAGTTGSSDSSGASSSASSVSAPSMEKFDVSTYLKLNDAQSYLDKGPQDTKQKAGIGKLIVDLISLLTKIIGSFALLVIIAGGITIMVSTGNQNMQTKGKEMIKFAIMGLVVAFMSLIIVTFVQSLFYTA